jgi:hypothetical protein
MTPFNLVDKYQGVGGTGWSPLQSRQGTVLVPIKSEVNFTLEQALKVKRGSRGIALLFL